MIEISLLPVDEQARAKTEQKGLGFQIPKFIPKGFGIAIVVLLATYAVSYLKASSLSRALTSNKLTLSDLKKESLQAQTIEARLGPPPGKVGGAEQPTGVAQTPQDSGERLRKRAGILRTRLEKRKVWSELLKEITLCCPEEIRLTETKLSSLRTGATSGQEKELVISGYYVTGVNPEMIFMDKLRGSAKIAAHYQRFTPMTQPEVDRTDFWIHCSEQ